MNHKNDNKGLQLMEALGWFFVSLALLIAVGLTIQGWVMG